jgi:hypothetical protein
MKFDFSKITNEQVEKLKALCVEFNLMPAPVVQAPIAQTPATEKKFGEGTLKDGTVIKWEGDAPLAVGTSLLVIDPANPEAFLPAPEGEHELADGTKFTIKDGKIEAITPVEVVAPPATPDMSAQVAQMSEQLKEVSEKFEAVSKEKETLNVELSASKTEIESVKKSLEETNAKLKETLEMFSKVLEAPASEPIETPANKPMSGIGSKIKS